MSWRWDEEDPDGEGAYGSCWTDDEPVAGQPGYRDGVANIPSDDGFLSDGWPINRFRGEAVPIDVTMWCDPSWPPSGAELDFILAHPGLDRRTLSERWAEFLDNPGPASNLDPQCSWDSGVDSTTEITSPSENTMPRAMMKRSHEAYAAESTPPVAIFIHAGAGYHSIQNENVHLAMCSKAASEAMKCLRKGATAVEAVEVAIKVLEDNEITNAGYGSNLSIDGIVECDATIVDHFGRSGACGAVPNIKNPISLAKLILETSSKPLTLRRVPPNFLVGEGAKRFAMEHGMDLVTNQQLTSRNANDRYQKWRADLLKAGGHSLNRSSPSGSVPDGFPRTKPEEDRGQDEMTPYTKARKGLLRDHTSAILTGMWNEGQPDSPSSGPNTPPSNGSNPPRARSSLPGPSSNTQQPRTSASAQFADGALTGSPVKRAKTMNDGRARPAQDLSKSTLNADGPDDVISLDKFPGDDASVGSDWAFVEPPSQPSQTTSPKPAVTEQTAEPNDTDFDLITDTMGAIAIDCHGNIAAGSSSGGIGMKHMGRTGPAALVGIGTSVIPPFNEQDLEPKFTAAVTSGTGEHMAATMAAQKCAERLKHGTRKSSNGRDCLEMDETQIMESFVLNDFMGHPGVRNQSSARAIGVMAVVMTKHGIYCHWAHNTDSFALASMSSEDSAPATVMSRLPEGAPVNIGARKISIREEPDW